MPANDILLYFPVFDRFADYSRGMLEHFDGISQAFNDSPFKIAAETMIEKGYAYDYISDLQLTNSFFYEESIQTEGNIYKTIIIPQCNYIPVETFSHILRMANDGAKIVFYGDLPENISGWAYRDEKNDFFNNLKSGINFTPTNNPYVLKASYGNGMLLSGNDLEQLLTFAGLKRETMTDQDLAFVRRETMSGFVYFIKNQSEMVFDGWIPLFSESSAAAVFNPVDGRFGLAKFRPGSNERIEVYSKMEPGESLIIQTFYNDIHGDLYEFLNPLASPQEISGKWKVDFIDGGPSLPPGKEIGNLISWTEMKTDELKDFSGTARYTINFKKPSGKADAWKLDFGKVCESATVILNGEDLGSLIGPQFNLILSKKQLMNNNMLEISVSNLMANRIAYMDRNKIPWKKFYNINMAARLRQNSKNGLFDASEWEPRESGLIGPVTLTPMIKVR
jgi:hypothetical protein